MKSTLIFFTLIVIAFSGCSHADDLKAFAEALAKAMAANDLIAIRAVVAEARKALGDKAGIPEVADDFKKPPAGAMLLTHDEAQRGLAPHFSQLEKMRWWKIGADPLKLTAPLRGVASVITGNVAAARALLDGAERSLALAKEAADFLIWAQEQAGAGCYPFPAARGTSDARAMEVATRFLKEAETAGKLDKVVRNGWAFDDLGTGGLQFDNGECGVSMFELYELTKDALYLDSARKAADWAMAPALSELELQQLQRAPAREDSRGHRRGEVSRRRDSQGSAWRHSRPAHRRPARRSVDGRAQRAARLSLYHFIMIEYIASSTQL